MEYLKTPITYYGGKQRMLKYILPLIPAHTLYCEPFCGGAAVFFAKPKSAAEIINDTNGNVVNFYRVLQTRFDELEREVRCTLHSRQLYDQAVKIYKNPQDYDEVMRAWAFWTATTQSFLSIACGCWARSFTRDQRQVKLQNMKRIFTKVYAERLEHAQIESCDAVELIGTWDKEHAFFYCDPPYYQADMGHYKGYTLGMFEDLLKVLSTLKGKFLLSSYPSELLSDYVNENHWHSIELAGKISIFSSKGSYCKPKTEVLTANYPIGLPC